MLPADFHPDAGVEIEELVAFFDQRPPGRGEEFREAAAATVDFLRRHPRVGTPHGTVARKRRVAGFPVAIYYVERPNCLWVVAVPHASRQQDYWLGRLNETN